MSHHPSGRHSHYIRIPRGVSLVELMVAMAIGLVVVGAVFTNYLSNAAGARQTSALTQVTSDAALVLGILRNHIAIAGYGEPTSATGARMTTNFDSIGYAIFGCDHGFEDFTGSDITSVTCADEPAATAAAQPVGNSLIVRYVSNGNISPLASTTLADSSTANRPTDCTGAGLKQAVGQPLLADNRFQIDPAKTTTTAGKTLTTPPSLECWGNGNGTNGAYAPLVENVYAMHILYGIGDEADSTGKFKRVVSYKKASDLGSVTSIEWDKVLAVRVCVVVRSTDEVMPAITNYMDCDREPATPTDRRLYRAFTSTVLINNRLSSAALNP